MLLFGPSTGFSRRFGCAATLLCASLASRGARADEPDAPTQSADEAAAPATPPGADESPAKPVVVRSVDVRARSEFSSYADSDHVFVQTPVISGSVANPTAGWSVGGSYLVDVVSAASVDIVSTASRRWIEARQAGALNAAYKPKSFGLAAAASVSSEPDYLSLTAGATATQDLDDKNITLLLGLSHGRDIAGRSSTPFSVFSHPLNRESIKAGITLVLNPSTIAMLVADVGIETGDQSKVYRYVPLFAPGTTVPLGAPIDVVDRLRTSARPLEQLPLFRDRMSLWLQLAHRERTLTLRGEERAYADSWGAKASTTDLRLLIDVGRRLIVGPHLRFHGQSSVDFWQRAYVLGPGLSYPQLRTGDRELGPLLTFTLGQTLRWAVGPPDQPRSWTIGVDVNLAYTQYLDDLYLTHRFSGIGAVSLEAEL